MGRDRLTQFRNAHHRWILVVAIHHRIRRRAADILRARMVGKPLAEIDGIVVARELRTCLKMVTGRSAKTLFMDVMEKSSRPGRQARVLHRPACAGQMLV